MKIEIIISDKAFREAEDTAKNPGISPERLYSKAIRQFVEKHKYDSEDITAKLNEFYSRKDISFDSFWD